MEQFDADGTVADGSVDDGSVEESTVEGLDDGSVEDMDVDDVLVLEEIESELVLDVWEPTGEPRVDAALDLMTTLDPDDVHQHAAVFTEIHQQLRGTLTDLDATP